MDKEKDLLLFEDEHGTEYTMEVLEYFEYDGKEFAMLMEVDDLYDENDESDEQQEEKDMYIMQVIVDDETQEESFIPIDDDKLDKIVDALEQLDEEYDDLGEDFPEGEDE